MGLVTVPWRFKPAFRRDNATLACLIGQGGDDINGVHNLLQEKPHSIYLAAGEHSGLDAAIRREPFRRRGVIPVD